MPSRVSHWYKCPEVVAATCGFSEERGASMMSYFLWICNHLSIYSNKIFKYLRGAFSLNLASFHGIIVIPKGNCHWSELLKQIPDIHSCIQNQCRVISCYYTQQTIIGPVLPCILLLINNDTVIFSNSDTPNFLENK